MVGDVSAVIFPDHGMRPLAALTAGFRLFKDPQNTRQVALLEIALGTGSQGQVFRRFISCSTGQMVIRERRSLVPTLDDHDYLRSLPKNSLGRHYLAFMESEGLSAQGLMEATPAFTEHLATMPEAVRLFSDYTQRGAHDLYHILTGYGRDELGEVCVLAMAYEQLKIRGYKVIAVIGSLVVRKFLRRIGAGTEGVFDALAEASAIGRDAAWIPGLDMEAALAEDLDALRLRLNIPRPARYDGVIDRVKAKTLWVRGPFARLLA